MSQEDKAAEGRDIYSEVAAKHGMTRAEAKEAVLKGVYGAGVSPFTKVAMFHRRFGLPGLEQYGPPRELTDEEALFRINFMLEELAEYTECSGFEHVAAAVRTVIFHMMEQGSIMRLRTEHRDMHGELDALVDLSYVLHGTALFHGFRRFDEAFDDVHAANMRKVRATSEGESKRGTKLDVVKPQGWTAPVLTEFLK